jgi:hypothetical protein
LILFAGFVQTKKQNGFGEVKIDAKKMQDRLQNGLLEITPVTQKIGIRGNDGVFIMPMLDL